MTGALTRLVLEGAEGAWKRQALPVQPLTGLTVTAKSEVVGAVRAETNGAITNETVARPARCVHEGAQPKGRPMRGPARRDGPCPIAVLVLRWPVVCADEYRAGET